MKSTADRTLLRSTLVPLLSLALACSTSRYAQPDYSRHPGQETRMAFDYMVNVAGEACDHGGFGMYTYPACERLSIDENSLEYVEKVCVNSRYERLGGVMVNNCTADQPQAYSLPWDSMRKIVPSATNVKICLEDRTCVTIHGFRNREQARNFAEAINRYVTAP